MRTARYRSQRYCTALPVTVTAEQVHSQCVHAYRSNSRQKSNFVLILAMPPSRHFPLISKGNEMGRLCRSQWGSNQEFNGAAGFDGLVSCNRIGGRAEMKCGL